MKNPMSSKRTFVVLLVLAAVLLVANWAIGAEAPKVPYTKGTENMCGVSLEYVQADGASTGVDPALADEVVLRLIDCEGLPLRDLWNNIIPKRVEIRRHDSSAASPQRMPLLRVMWDADGDGVADFIAVVIGYRNGEPEFLTLPIVGEPHAMSEQEWFKPILAPTKES